MTNKLIYNITEKPKTIEETLIYALQQCMAVFVATVLIANICDTPISSCLFGACTATLVYQLITKGKSPMFISSCGATCSAVIGALATGNGNNYLAVVIGGFIIFAVYCAFAIFIKYKGIEALNKLLPPAIVGSITIVIGINLAAFIPTYVAVNNVSNTVNILVALFSMFVTAISSHYFKGFWKTVPFLIGLISGYVLSIILTLTNIAPLVDFTIFNDFSLFSIPDFTFMHWGNNILNKEVILQVLLLFTPVAVCALCEHYSDHKVLSNIIGVDLTEEPGLHRTLIGDGAASAIGTILCGLPNTSYGESIATTGFSRVASRFVITIAAFMLGVLSFITPIQLIIQSIPSCVFGGLAMILYGYIALSGLKTILNNKIDLNDNKNMILIGVILTIGVSGIYIFHASFAGVSLAMIIGIILNLTLKERN